MRGGNLGILTVNEKRLQSKEYNQVVKTRADGGIEGHGGAAIGGINKTELHIQLLFH